MNKPMRTVLGPLTLAIALAACGGGGDSEPEAPLNTDYSNLKVAASREGALVYAKSPEALLNPLRNGVRLSLSAAPVPAIAGVNVPNTASQAPQSATTLQVEGVDEPDLVKYDGRHIYSVRPEVVPTKPGMTRNVLKIAKTNPASATLEVTSEFEIAGLLSTLPIIYSLPAADGATQFIAAVSQDLGGWLSATPQAAALVVQPDRTKVQLLDVRDPYNVSQAWQIELDGWLRATRKIDNMLYIVHSYRPRLPGIEWPADSQEKKESNERRIRNAGAPELMPKLRVNGGAAQQLATPGDCVVAADLASNEAYTDLLVLTSIDLDARAVRDVECLSTNVNGVYVSRDSVYVGGEAFPGTGAVFTVLYKFGLSATGMSYRATGVIGGRLPWMNASHFMDEHEGLLRILTTEQSVAGPAIHRLSILKEAEQRLERIAMLPNPERPAPIGKPADEVQAVRFIGERAYVVTARTVDPLYVIDLSDPAAPFIAGSLEVPGAAAQLQPLKVGDSDLLLSLGWRLGDDGGQGGLKVELFDVSDIALPRSVGMHVFGTGGAASEALNDPHALTLLSLPGETTRHRIGLPIDVFERDGQQLRWQYSGFHFLEVSDAGGSPELRLQGVLKTEESSAPGTYPSYVVPRRVVMHGDAMYGVHGGVYISSFWDHLRPN
jgi:hypothetical protein